MMCPSFALVRPTIGHRGGTVRLAAASNRSVDDIERAAIAAEGYDPDDPAVVAAPGPHQRGAGGVGAAWHTAARPGPVIQ